MTSTNAEIVEYLRKHLDSAKFKHSLGVTRVAAALAAKHGVNVKDAELAGLLHDIGRIYSGRELVSYARKRRLKIPGGEEIMKRNPKLLHSFVGADIAGKLFTKKRDVLEAVAFHTLAKPKMSKLARIVYLADYTAPDRRFPGVDKVRKFALRDMDGAYRAALGSKLLFVLKKKHWLHPLAVEAWNELIKTE